MPYIIPVRGGNMERKGHKMTADTCKLVLVWFLCVLNPWEESALIHGVSAISRAQPKVCCIQQYKLITAVPVEMGSLDCVQEKMLPPHSWDCGSILPHREQPCIESSCSHGGWAVAGVLEVECHYDLGCCGLPSTEVVLEMHNSCASAQLLLGICQEKLKTDASACWGWKESIPLFQQGLGYKSFSAVYWNKLGFQFTPPVDNLWLQNIMIQWYHKKLWNLLKTVVS